MRASAGTIGDHIFGIRDLSRHDVTVVNFWGELPRSLNLERFDVLIIHYSLTACHDSYIRPLARINLRNFQGVKVAFVQDEYRFIDDTTAALAAMRISALMSVVGEEVIDQIYPPEKLPGVRRETVLTGYVPEHLLTRDVPRYQDRPIDVGYRARKLPAWLGAHGQEKWLIAEKFLLDADRYGLKYDISGKESDRIYGDKWLEFVASCKAMIGVESGSSICDFSGQIQADVEAHLARHPDAAFEELRDLYFKDQDGRLVISVISPRCFEAAAMRTLMIQYEGRYSDRLTAGRHYVVLDRDHGNMDEVVAILRDPQKAQEIIDRAYNEVALDPANTFRAMVDFLDEVIDERHAALCAGDTALPLDASRSVSAVRFTRMYNRATSICFHAIEASAPRLVKCIDWMLRPVPPAAAKALRTWLQSRYHGLVKKRRGVLVGMPFIATVLALFTRRSRHQIVALFGREMVRGRFLSVVRAAMDVRRIADMAGVVALAHGVRVAMAYDTADRALILRAYDSDRRLDLEALRPLGFDELARGLGDGTIAPRKAIWSPAGLGGLSQSSPFTGVREFDGLIWGLETHPVKMVDLLRAELSGLIDPVPKKGQNMEPTKIRRSY